MPPSKLCCPIINSLPSRSYINRSSKSIGDDDDDDDDDVDSDVNDYTDDDDDDASMSRHSSPTPSLTTTTTSQYIPHAILIIPRNAATSTGIGSSSTYSSKMSSSITGTVAV